MQENPYKVNRQTNLSGYRPAGPASARLRQQVIMRLPVIGKNLMLVA